MHWKYSNVEQYDGTRRKFRVFKTFDEALWFYRKQGLIKAKIERYSWKALNNNIKTYGYSYMENYYPSELQIIIEEALFVCWDEWNNYDNEGSFMAHTKKVWDYRIKGLLDYYGLKKGKCNMYKYRKELYKDFILQYGIRSNIESRRLKEKIIDNFNEVSLDYTNDEDGEILPKYQITYPGVEEAEEKRIFTKADKSVAKYRLRDLNLSEEDYFDALKILNGGKLSESRVTELENKIRKKNQK